MKVRDLLNALKDTDQDQEIYIHLDGRGSHDPIVGYWGRYISIGEFSQDERKKLTALHGE